MLVPLDKILAQSLRLESTTKSFHSIMSFIQTFFSGARAINIGGSFFSTPPEFDAIDISKMSSVTINGVVVRGNNISMNNGILYVDGKPHDSTNPQTTS